VEDPVRHRVLDLHHSQQQHRRVDRRPFPQIGVAPSMLERLLQPGRDAHGAGEYRPAKTRHRNPRTAMRYVRPGGVAVAEVTELLDIAPRRR